MARTGGSTGRRALTELEERFRSWRGTRKRGEKIPRTLWQSAVELVGPYSLEEIAAALSLDLGRLRKRVELTVHARKRPGGTASVVGHRGFVEVEPLLEAGYRDECTVEAEDGRGKKVTIHLRGSASVVEIATRIAKELWSTDR